MYSLINLDQYKKPHKQWSGYVLELAKEKAIYTGISYDLAQRLRQHMTGKGLCAAFVQEYGPPIRVLELFFCDTEAQARHWERATSDQLYDHYKDRPIYHLGWRPRRPVERRPLQEIKGRKHKLTEAGMLAYMQWLKR